MVSFFLCLAVLICGYLFYGKYVDQTFNPDDRETPAVAINDGIDYVVLPQWKLFMIQLLNIAGLGPIFGALSGAIWGPVVFLWITFGTVFAGAVHDYFAGMLSERNNGASISEVTGIYLGGTMKNVMRVFSVILLIMVGTVFAVGPAGLLVTLFKNSGVESGIVLNPAFWLAIILCYYFIATFISVDKVIGKIYPLFGICLIIMAIGVGFGTVAHGGIPEIFSNFKSLHPKGTPIWAFMFITVACGAISGFHATQSPLMARCLKSERQGHFVFYGAMVAEGIIALIWAAAGVTLLGVDKLQEMGGGNANSVYTICTMTMGKIGIILAMLGVIACPITSGDTAFRSARLTLADWFKLDMGNWKTRLLLCIPVLGVGAILGFGNTLKHAVEVEKLVDGKTEMVTQMVSYIDHQIIWRYFSWSNQTLAMIVLWAGAMYLAQNKRNYWICAVPATFMSAVSMTYFMMAGECMGLIAFFKNNAKVGYPVGIIFAVACLALFLSKAKNAASKAAKVA
ncbi:MAG: carbon starvation protein A [Oscillospiraceae bacterium]|nr:carbon starvation protein A [Oscillospiraceae bacterium]